MTWGGKDRVLDGKDESTARRQKSPYRRTHGPEIFYVVQRQRTVDEAERSRRRGQLMERASRLGEEAAIVRPLPKLLERTPDLRQPIGQARSELDPGAVALVRHGLPPTDNDRRVPANLEVRAHETRWSGQGGGTRRKSTLVGSEKFPELAAAKNETKAVPSQPSPW